MHAVRRYQLLDLTSCELHAHDNGVPTQQKYRKSGNMTVNSFQ